MIVKSEARRALGRRLVVFFSITPARGKTGFAIFAYFLSSWAYANWSLGYPHFSPVNLALQSTLGLALLLVVAALGWIGFFSSGKDFAVEALRSAEQTDSLLRVVKVVVSAGAIALAITLLLMVILPMLTDNAVDFITDYFSIILASLFICSLPFVVRFLK